MVVFVLYMFICVYVLYVCCLVVIWQMTVV